MSRRRKAQPPAEVEPEIPGYDAVLSGLFELLESARRAAARSVNAVMTAAYWEMGRRIVEHEQQGHSRAAYGKALLARLSSDLTRLAGRGFSVDNLELMRRFYLAYPTPEISETPSRKSASGGYSQRFPARSLTSFKVSARLVSARAWPGPSRWRGCYRPRRTIRDPLALRG
jgi:DUF1016 N-terminal domain